MLKKAELLSPAGNLKNLRYALAYGADAVYAGQPRYSLRVRNNDFSKLENLAIGIQETHAAGKLFFMAVNISPHNSKLKTFMADMAKIIALKPDALIMADPGLIMWVRERWPEMTIHLSVQANVVNYASLRFWYNQGISRVILSRELSIEEIAEMRQEVPEMELEVFVHGALCIAYSGRCLLSGYMNHRDPNQGSCTNACRWEYDVKPAKEDEVGNLNAEPTIAEPVIWQPEKPAPQLGEGATTERAFMLGRKDKPEEQMPAFEDEHGTYIMNSKDLRAIQHVKTLMEIGVDCIKIEGRTKSHYYAARTAQLYRRAIDDAAEGKDFDMSLMDSLENLASRGYTEGFLRRHVHDEYQNYENGSSRSDKQQFVGEVLSVIDNTLEVDVKNHFEVGDKVELMLPEGNLRFNLPAMQDKYKAEIEVAKGSGQIVHIPIPEQYDSSTDFSKALLLRDLM